MIVHVLGRMTAGGNERLCLELIKRAPAGTRQVLLTIGASPYGALEPLFRAVPGLEFLHEPYSAAARFSFVWRMAMVLRRLQPRGLIAYSFGLHILVALAAKAVPHCRVIARVGNPPPAQGPLRNMFRRLVQASRWVGVPLWSCSETVHEQLKQLGAPMPTDSRAMLNGIDLASLRLAAARGRAQRETGRPVIGMIARLDAIKDHDTLVRAFARLVKVHPTVKLWLAGDGARREEIEKLATQLAVRDSLCFLGFREDVGEVLGQLDVFVFSTTPAEGFGIALAEAMAIGLPIVATDVPACREVLAQGTCGELVPASNDAIMADKILSLLDDPEEARRLSARAAERAARTYDIETCARTYYAYLLSPGRPS